MEQKEKYALIGKLIEEIKLRKYSFETGKSYINIVRDFLNSNKGVREYLLKYSDKSRSSMRKTYFAIKFFHENVLNEKFSEKIPLAKNSLKLPIILNKKEISWLISNTKNTKHKLLLMFLYYTGMRLDEVRGGLIWILKES